MTDNTIQMNLFQYFLDDEQFTVKEATKLVNSVMKVNNESIRARIYEGVEKGLFEKVSRGVYKVTSQINGDRNDCLLINGDGRDLSMIPDNSIDGIITDHPYDLSKALTGGNRKFASYELFKYNQKDFEEKQRVLKEKAEADEAEKIKQEVDDSGLTLMQILLTHGHLDHVGAAAELAQHYGVPVFGPEKEDEFWLQGLPAQSRMFGLEECQPLTPDRWLNEGDTISIGNVTLQVLHCPGHTPGHVVCFDDRAKLLISGDVIFKGGVGRSDFPRGDHNQLISSIKDKLLPLGDDVTFIPGHGPLSTLGYERLHNPFLQDEMPVW